MIAKAGSGFSYARQCIGLSDPPPAYPAWPKPI